MVALAPRPDSELVPSPGAVLQWRCRRLQRKGQSDHQTGAWVPHLRGTGSRFVSRTWRPARTKTHPQILLTRPTSQGPGSPTARFRLRQPLLISRRSTATLRPLNRAEQPHVPRAAALHLGTGPTQEEARLAALVQACGRLNLDSATEQTCRSGGKPVAVPLGELREPKVDGTSVRGHTVQRHAPLLGLVGPSLPHAGIHPERQGQAGRPEESLHLSPSLLKHLFSFGQPVKVAPPGSTIARRVAPAQRWNPRKIPLPRLPMMVFTHRNDPCPQSDEGLIPQPDTPCNDALELSKLPGPTTSEVTGQRNITDENSLCNAIDFVGQCHT